MMRLSLPRSKAYLKAHAREARRWYFAQFHAFTAADLRRTLANLGVRAGDCLLVHSSFDAFRGFSGRPSDVVHELQRLVGASGALLMPTMPFTGTAVDHARTQTVFDVRRTPSRMGLLTEIFRRAPGVQRSVHPTHPVAAWGARASQLLADHHAAATPCGRGTPFARLLEQSGKVALLGTGIDVLTLYHALEESLEERLPFSPFTREIFRLEALDAGGRLRVTQTRLYEPSVSRRRNLAPLARELRRNGQWHEARAGALPVVVLAAADIAQAAREMADRGIYCYD
jgi:aminoglycoside 3-N-acetyltransferase